MVEPRTLHMEPLTPVSGVRCSASEKEKSSSFRVEYYSLLGYQQQFCSSSSVPIVQKGVLMSHSRFFRFAFGIQFISMFGQGYEMGYERVSE